VGGIEETIHSGVDLGVHATLHSLRGVHLDKDIYVTKEEGGEGEASGRGR